MTRESSRPSIAKARRSPGAWQKRPRAKEEENAQAFEEVMLKEVSKETELTDSVETVPTDDALPRSHRLKKNDPTIIRANAFARPTYMQNKMKNF